MWNVGVRFDVLALRWPPGAREPEVRHYRHAFQSVGKYPVPLLTQRARGQRSDMTRDSDS